ncbi:TPA: hypothetical protein ACH3X1_004165 [Trebouxia sp. C0004]
MITTSSDQHSQTAKTPPQQRVPPHFCLQRQSASRTKTSHSGQIHHLPNQQEPSPDTVQLHTATEPQPMTDNFTKGCQQPGSVYQDSPQSGYPENDPPPVHHNADSDQQDSAEGESSPLNDSEVLQPQSRSSLTPPAEDKSHSAKTTSHLPASPSSSSDSQLCDDRTALDSSEAVTNRQVPEAAPTQFLQLRRPQCSRITARLVSGSEGLAAGPSNHGGSCRHSDQTAKADQMDVDALPSNDPIPGRHKTAGKANDNLQAALSRLADDPVANLHQLPLIQSALQASHHHRQQLKSLAQQMAHVLPHIVSTDGQGIMHVKQAELQLLCDSIDQANKRVALSGEESRVGLGVLMIGLWCHKLMQNLAAQGAGDSSTAAEAVNSAASSSAAAVSQPSSSPVCTASQSTVKLSHVSADSSTPVASLEQAAAQTASQEAPSQAIGSWADLMSVTASDAEEEEEATCIPNDVSMVSAILRCTDRDAAPAEEATTQLRSYQQRALDHIKGGGNYILVAPTGSGKTRIAVELAGLLLQKTPEAKIVFLATTVALAQQQAGVFQRADCIKRQSARVECLVKSSSMTDKRWRMAIRLDSVLIMTAQQLLNNLHAKAAHLQQIDLLVLDECHHCWKDSPYNHIMQHYYKKLSPQEQAHTRVLGLTASPGGDVDVGESTINWRTTNLSSLFYASG